VLRRLILVAAVALVAAAPAWAHASFVRSTPSAGEVLERAPRRVTVEFSDGIRPGPRNAAVENGGRSILRGKPRVVGGTTLVLPLERIGDGDYSVRWSVVSDDGHVEEGVFAFGVGVGREPPLTTLTARTQITWSRVLSRTLFFVGVLAAAGAAAFALLVLRPLRVERELVRPQSHVLFFGFLSAFLGADALIHGGAADATRFERAIQVAATVAAVGGAAAALAPLYPRLRYLAWSCAFALLATPTLSGHALDRDQPAVIAPLADFAHAAAAAVWFGGLLSLAFALPHATEESRGRAVRRFSSVALVAVVVVGAAGVVRAVTELGSIDDLWTTSYGRAILVKTAIFGPLLGLGWLNRVALLDAFARLRRSTLVELSLLTGIAIAVGVLVDLPPGRLADERAAAGGLVATPASAPLPPEGDFVDARQVGSLAVGIAAGRGRTTVTVLGPDGNGVRGLDVRVDGRRSAVCGPGCYRAAVSRPSVVRVGNRAVSFSVPARPRDGTALLRRATRAYTSARSVVFEERLASGPGRPQVSTFRLAAPNRLAYSIRGGPEAIVVGARRWDRTPGGEWEPSPQTPLRVPSTYWSSRARNAYLVAPDTVSFFDPRLPAWFRLRVDPRTGRPRGLRMVAAAHFMTDRYSAFDRPVEISPPSR
jgi:copper transport protein